MPADIGAAVARFGVTGISCVPSIWRDFLASGIRFDTDGAHRWLRYVTISGGDLGEQELRRLKEAVGAAGFYKTYGQTEAFRLTCLLPHEFARRPTSVGRGFASARVGVMREDLSPAGPHEEGELILAGLGAMTGYLGGSGTDEKLIPNPLRAGPHDPAVAVRTGDFGFVDEEGYVFLRGRRDAMIKVHGNRVYPSEVARLILGVPGVRDAVAVGVPRPSAEAVLVAFVVLADDAPEEDLQRRMRQMLPPHMVPQVTIRCQGIPLTAGGKHDLTGLQRQAAHAVSGRNA
jgi:acyl-coenzyme A synthetase/AMP-(fatty) acid ligase